MGQVKVIDRAEFLKMADTKPRLTWLNSRRLILAHFWLAFAVFGVAIMLGARQMFIRSPLYARISDPEWYYCR